MATHDWQHHPYDHLMKGKSPTAFRVNDVRHQNINVGDVVQLRNRPEFIQHEKFKVVAKTEHPTIEQAINNIQHSNLNTRDKIEMINDFRKLNGPHITESHRVAQFTFHPVTQAPPTSLGS